jgi:hypothetical protein
MVELERVDSSWERFEIYGKRARVTSDGYLPWY